MVNWQDIERVGIFAFPEAEELDIVGIYEVLACVATLEDQGLLDTGHPLEVEVIASKKKIRCANGLLLIPHATTPDFSAYDLIVIPGGSGIRAVMADDAILSKIQDFSTENPIASVCTGALVLAKAGILSGKKASTHHGVRDELDEYCEVSTDRVTLDEGILTAGGVTSTLAAGLKILDLVYDMQVVTVVADELEIPASLRPDS
ncbi:MAG: DJ-1/PfpI family protein [Candidatus Thorarchaeota archaeon]